MSVAIEQPIETPEVTVTPEAAAPEAAPVTEPQKRYEYQPTDEQGRPIGGKQVILYSTSEELAEKLRDQNIQVIRKLREVTRKQRLGINDESPLPEEVERFEQPVEFKKKELTQEEIFQISQELNDPTRFVEARDRLLESAVGVNPDELTKVLNKQQVVTMQLLARQNASTFIATHPDFYGCAENLETLTDWMLKNRLSPTVKNFEFAYSRLKETGLFLEAPIVREVAPVIPENTAANSQPPADDPSRITEDQKPQEKRQARVPSGLNSRNASAAGVSPEVPALTWAEVDKMPSNEFARRYNSDPEFRKRYNALEEKRKQAVQPQS